MKRKGIRITVFLACLLALVYLLDCILCVKSPHGVNQSRAMYDQPEDTIDVVMMGSSHVHCNINTGALWDRYGIAAYNYSGAEQPLWNTYHNILELLKYQRPKVIVLDMFSPAAFKEDHQTTWLSENLLGMRFSLNKMKAVTVSAPEEKVADYIFGYPKYHTRYADLKEEDFNYFFWNREENQIFKGFTGLDGCTAVSRPDVSGVTVRQPMTAKSWEYFQRIVDLTWREGIKLVLVAAPYEVQEEEQAVFNWIADRAEEWNIPFLNFNLYYDELDLDFQTDFNDYSHLNLKGSVKYTEKLGAWLKAHYELPDRRGDARYESWEKDALKWREKLLAPAGV